MSILASNLTGMFAWNLAWNSRPDWKCGVLIAITPTRCVDMLKKDGNTNLDNNVNYSLTLTVDTFRISFNMQHTE